MPFKNHDIFFLLVNYFFCLIKQLIFEKNVDRVTCSGVEPFCERDWARRVIEHLSTNELSSTITLKRSLLLHYFDYLVCLSILCPSVTTFFPNQQMLLMRSSWDHPPPPKVELGEPGHAFARKCQRSRHFLVQGRRNWYGRCGSCHTNIFTFSLLPPQLPHQYFYFFFAAATPKFETVLRPCSLLRLDV